MSSELRMPKKKRTSLGTKGRAKKALRLGSCKVSLRKIKKRVSVFCGFCLFVFKQCILSLIILFFFKKMSKKVKQSTKHAADSLPPPLISEGAPQASACVTTDFQ